jgi:hypothetical protein
VTVSLQPKRHFQRLRHVSRISDGCEIDQPHPIGEVVDEVRRDLDCQACLANPTGAGQRHQPSAVFQELRKIAPLELPTDEARDWPRQVVSQRLTM